MKLTDHEKIERIKNLYNKFHSKMLVLAKKQLELLKKVKKMIDEKKLKEVRDKIKK